jgi:hypothetical protein
MFESLPGLIWTSYGLRMRHTGSLSQLPSCRDVYQDLLACLFSTLEGDKTALESLAFSYLPHALPRSVDGWLGFAARQRSQFLSQMKLIGQLPQLKDLESLIFLLHQKRVSILFCNAET